MNLRRRVEALEAIREITGSEPWEVVVRRHVMAPGPDGPVLLRTIVSTYRDGRLTERREVIAGEPEKAP
jgi:hypothetical protein